MRIGIHQPNFLPWMGYFYKMAKCDTFVFLDHVEYTKNSYTKRVKIHKADTLHEDQYITVPLKKHSDNSRINQLLIADDPRWQQKVHAKIYEVYHKAPYYYQIELLMDQFFRKPIADKSFSKFNMEIIRLIAEMLGVDRTFEISSQLNLPKTSRDVNVDIIAILEGSCYISGMGAKKYQDESLFEDFNVGLKYSDFKERFQHLGIEDHFLNKSIISYLAHYSIDDIKVFLSRDQINIK